jgi:hypothetical protein
MVAAPKATGEYFEHIAAPGERWDLLAHRYYGDALLTGLIIEANRRLWRDDLAAIAPVIAPRTRLKIPVIEKPAIDPARLPPWKREAAS